MKVLVDISENVLARMKLVSKVSSVDGVCQAVLDGTVLDNLTNGEVIKAVFPNLKFEQSDVFVETAETWTIMSDKKDKLWVDLDWWNSPYKVEDRTKRGLNYADQDTLMSAT